LGINALTRSISALGISALTEALVHWALVHWRSQAHAQAHAFCQAHAQAHAFLQAYAQALSILDRQRARSSQLEFDQACCKQKYFHYYQQAMLSCGDVIGIDIGIIIVIFAGKFVSHYYCTTFEMLQNMN